MRTTYNRTQFSLVNVKVSLLQLLSSMMRLSLSKRTLLKFTTGPDFSCTLDAT